MAPPLSASFASRVAGSSASPPARLSLRGNALGPHLAQPGALAPLADHLRSLDAGENNLASLAGVGALRALEALKVRPARQRAHTKGISRLSSLRRATRRDTAANRAHVRASTPETPYVTQKYEWCGV